MMTKCHGYWPAWAALCGALGVLGLSGCGGRSDLPPLAEVSGKVTLDGQPLPYGEIQFVPDNTKGTQGPPAVGSIDAEGNYRVATAGVEGAMVGFHKIRVEASKPPAFDGAPPGPSLTPARYNNPDTSGLTAEVKAGEDNQVDLPLSSAP